MNTSAEYIEDQDVVRIDVEGQDKEFLSEVNKSIEDGEQTNLSQEISDDDEVVIAMNNNS